MARSSLAVLIVAASLLGCGSPESLDQALPDVVDYNFHVKPILSDRCYACHGPDAEARQAGLRLDIEEGAKAYALESRGHAVVPGSRRRSKLFQRITARDATERMPPEESNLSLTEEEIALLGRWIDQGADWKPHWAFLTPTKPDLPEVVNTTWPQQGLDFFILNRLEQEGLEPSPEADKLALLRRVTFDLTGLPPTLEEVDAFLADTSAAAYDRAVDRLLASEAYGEHMASEWMDIARYADTHGYQNDRDRRMWPWRDWVIGAFNSNMPFDAFSTWQIAGDLLPNASRDQILATAFNRNHRQTNEGGSIEEEFRTEYVADRTNTLGTAFMGLTMECARCHDHKYDPISQKDYYQLFSFFNNVDESGQTSHFTQAVPVPALLLTEDEKDAQIAALAAAVAEQEARIPEVQEAALAAFESWANQGTPLGMVPQAILEYDFDTISEGITPARRGPAGKAVFEPVVVPGRFGRALSFDGESGINIEGVGLFARHDPFTLSFWIRVPEEDMTSVLVHRTQAALDAGSRGYELSLVDGKLVGQLAHMWPENTLRVKGNDPVPVATWVHVALTYDGSSRASGLRLFMEGDELSTTTERDNLYGTILYENLPVPVTVGYRFRDTGFRDGAIDALKIFDQALPAIDVARLADEAPSDDESARFEYFLAHRASGYDRAKSALRDARARLHEAMADVPRIMVMREMTTDRMAHVLERGQYDAKGEAVEPGVPEAVLPWNDTLPRDRLGLAKWLFDDDHPLTARVAVNRFWQRYFGTGLVSTPEDFGSQGSLPTHPALLDYLATTFVESGWDMKAMHRMVVTSSTYRQSSQGSPELLERDPDNTLLARGPRLRLSAEMIRDQALFASGLLESAIGGPSVLPYQPAGLWEEKSGKRYVTGTGGDLYRRSLYTFFKRTSPPPSLITFDMPTRAQCIMRRQQTTTPMQALVLLNDPQYVEAARHIAERVAAEDSPSEQIAKAFRLVLTRSPSAEELGVLMDLYEEQEAHFEQSNGAARELLATGDSPWDTRYEPERLAALTMVSSALLSYDEAVIKY